MAMSEAPQTPLPAAHPQKVNFLKTFEISETQSLLLVGFLNQLNIYQVWVEAEEQNGGGGSGSGGSKMQQTWLKEYIIDNFDEELQVADVKVLKYKLMPFIQIAFGGTLGVIYLDEIMAEEFLG